MVALATLACVAYAALWPEWGFWGLLWLNLAAGVAQSALMPLGDSITLAAVRSNGLDYGRVRVWGSVSFILAAVASGWALAYAPPAVLFGNEGPLLGLPPPTVLVFARPANPPGTGPPGG